MDQRTPPSDHSRQPLSARRRLLCGRLAPIIAVVLTVVLLACDQRISGAAREAGTDLPQNPLVCGANTLVAAGQCASRCPGPCVCERLFDRPGAVHELCATPCSIPGACKGTERCAFLPQSQRSVCLPVSLKSTPGAAALAVDCMPDDSHFNPTCRNNTLVQFQTFFVDGTVSGSYCAEVLLETCTAGCTGKSDCRGIPDAGPVQPGDPCCPEFPSGSCRSGGVKHPPHGCRMFCCSKCQWKPAVEMNCPAWIPIYPTDAGPNG